MRIHIRGIRVIGIGTLICFLQMVVLPTIAWGQAGECPYDRANPSLENARISFKSLDYRCAEQEILDFLGQDGLTIEERADAHVLLAAVYYAKSKNEDEKRRLVVNQFKEAFRAYRDWRGELDISSTEFIEMMNEARVLVDQEEEQEAEEKPVVLPDEEQEKEPTYAKPTIGEKKPWYKKWWAIALGVGVVAGAVVLAAGGGGDDGGDGGTVIDTLPGPPDPPPGK
jgi:hypothetical protein